MTLSIPACDLASALDKHHDGESILSLDCFDTLLWRTTHEPVDVFAAIGAGHCLGSRARAERHARKAKRLRSASNEVSLGEIYRRLERDAGHEQIESAARREWEVESDHCFAFPPAVELIRIARARGMRVIVVSDMYLGAAGIRALIARAATEEVAAMIERVFCSSDHGVSKAEGLFRTVLAELGAQAHDVLHMGDNPLADQQSPLRLGIRALRVEQFPQALERQIRQEGAVAAMVDPRLRVSHPRLQLQRAPLALAWSRASTPAARLGLSALGPVLHGFARWLASEIEQLQLQGRRVRPLFLLRDGFLPYRVFERVAPELARDASQVELSRFAAFAASIRSAEDIVEYMTYVSDTSRFDAIASQLLLNARESGELIRRARRSSDPEKAFCAELLRPDNVALVAARSTRFAQRMLGYLNKHATIERGDTVMLVDIGYHGTIQDRIAPVLAAELGVEVTGRYLLMGDVTRADSNKSGFIGPDRYDERALDCIFSYVAILEQLCTSGLASPIGYDESGEVQRKGADLKAAQSVTRVEAQRACLDYVDAYRRAYPVEPRSIDVDALRQSACAALSRLLFLPSPDELEALQGFEHDVNMGVADKFQFFDAATGRDAIVRRGLSYAEHRHGQFIPAELRGEGLAVSVSHLALKRFGIDLRHGDFDQHAIRIPVLLAAAREASQTEIQAHPTHGGWYIAAVPLGSGSYAVGLRFGAVFEWLQLHAVGLVRAGDFMSGADLSGERDVSSLVVPEGVEQHASGLMHCVADDSFLFFPPLGSDGADAILTVVFRPIAVREAGTARTDLAPHANQAHAA
ncbi:MAG: hypothetical protein KJZ83_02365 [Burkholderiaceae bacterium]|nr:hypothetical protein [Burkholderiaceae bacterium]